VDIVLRTPAAAHGIPLLFSLGFLAILLLIYGRRRLVEGITSLSDRVIACVTGYLRPPPDPWLEISLRQAFADFDRELAAILHHQPTRR
jgi:hypothetical protein